MNEVGTIKSYSRKNGYGFVSSASGDYFFHATEWKGKTKYPVVGIPCVFFPVRTEKGLRAYAVR